MKKVTVDQMVEILMNVQEKTVVWLKARNSSNGLNSKPVNGDASLGKNPYYKSDKLIKTSEYHGVINFSYAEERRADTGDDTYTPTKSLGVKQGGVTMSPKGPMIHLGDAESSNVEWWLDGVKLDREEYERIVKPYKPIRKYEPSTGGVTGSQRALYLQNVYWIEIDDVRYELDSSLRM